MNKRILLIDIILVFIYVSCISQNDWEVIKTAITEDLHDIEFINNRVGFIYSYGTGNIYKTIDKGYSWTRIKQIDSNYLEQIQFINPRLGWICGEKGKVLKTLDCGSTWSDLSITSTDGNIYLYGMCIINDSVGYVSGFKMEERSQTSKIFLTTNGALSWTPVLSDIPEIVLNLEKKDCHIFGTGTGFILKFEIPCNSLQYVYKDTLGIIGQIRDIQFADNKFGIGVSFNGYILVTTDGGNSFTYKRITTNRLRSIAHLGRKKWIIVGDNNKNDGAVIYYTNDNGESWNKNKEFDDIHRVTINNRNIWIIGKNGLIAKRKK
jgi:photosystem II stability/assembly factor-like uncharacterized protein